MSTPKFQSITSSCVPLNRNNVDTDQIIPARFLKGTVKSGFGVQLFYDLRYLASGEPNPAFSLNQPQYQGSQILVSAHNFGCGSSREHAPWALKDYGFSAILAISFADIFKNNSLKNHLLPVVLPESVILGLLSQIEATPELKVTVNLKDQVVQWLLNSSGNDLKPVSYPFEIDPFRKECLMNGVDDIGYTLGYANAIQAYEASH
jgi:3-isopropylmalate/(R)-2-methylmalate dehydratase small subunit